MLQIAATFALAGFIWHIQCVAYPLFAKVDAAAFPEYHREHCRRITWVVAPLMLIECVTALWLIFTQPNLLLVVSLGPLALIWISTAFVQVPLHQRLTAGGKDEAIIQHLIRTNWIRTLAWSSRAILIGALIYV